MQWIKIIFSIACVGLAFISVVSLAALVAHLLTTFTLLIITLSTALGAGLIYANLFYWEKLSHAASKK